VVALRPTGRMLKLSGACVAVAAAGAGAGAAEALDRGARHVGARAAATKPAAGGQIYGGITPQKWPIVIELDKDATRVKRIVTGLDMTCTSNENFGTTDGFNDVKINSKSRFKATYGPQRIDAAGTPADIEGAITGRRSRDGSSMKGTWSYKVTFYDAAGTTATDTCQSGLVSWKARQ
jgi:hypothetical protein